MFKTPLNITAERRSNYYILNSQLIYQYNDDYIVVPTGFRTNFASIPKIFKSFIDDNSPIIRDAAVIHDYLYSRANLYQYTRKQADVILRDGMKCLGASWLKRNIVYISVRIAGRSNYKI